MEFLAFLYTVLLVAICLMMALLLYRSAKPAANRDDAERKEWLRQQLEAQNRQMDAKLAEMAQQNLAAMGHISETLQASVQSMSTALAAGQGTQQQTMEQRLQRFTDVAHSGKVLLRHLCQLRVHLAVLRFQLLTQPFLPFCIVPVCGRLCRAVQQQGHHQADGHQKHRVKKR
jgi:hypothetical protein